MNRYRVGLELTNHCNFKCKMCPHAVYRQHGKPGQTPQPARPTLRNGRLTLALTQYNDQVNRFDRDKGFISEQVFAAAVENCNRYAREVTIGFFGEQMLHPKFKEYVKRLRSDNYELILNSNWSHFTADHVEALRSFDSVRISIDSIDPETWERLNPGGPFKGLDGRFTQDRYATLVEKIQYWLRLKDRPVTHLIGIMSSANPADRQGLPDVWSSRMRGGDRVITKSVLSYGGVMRDDGMSENPCNVPSEGRVTIAWDGRCSPCNLDVNIAMDAGKLHEVGDLRRIVESPAWARRLQGIRDREGICANCFDAQNHSQNHHGPADQPPGRTRGWLRPFLRRAG